MGSDLVNDVYIARAPRLAARKVAGEMVILNADDSSLYVLNGLATVIWEAADGRTSLRTIVDDIICRDYDVDAETAMRDAGELVRDLAGFGVLRTLDRAEEGAGS
jgi:hypothetical protein